MPITSSTQHSFISHTPRVDFVKPNQAIKPVKALEADHVLFSGESDANLIDDDVYGVLSNALFTNIHVHQSGSTLVEYLKLQVVNAIERGQLKELDIVDSETGSVSKRAVSKADLNEPWVRNLMDIEVIRNYYRAHVSDERKKIFMATDESGKQAINPYQMDLNLTPELMEKVQSTREESLGKYLGTSKKINRWVKNLATSYFGAFEFARTSAESGVRYAEFRIAPSSYDSSLENLLYWVNEGFKDAQKRLERFSSTRPDFDYGLIVLFERHRDPQAAVKLAHEVVQLKREGKANISGVDLAGGELDHSVEKFREAFQIIKDYNDDPDTQPKDRIGVTIHAGETPRSEDLKGYESIEKAIEIGSSPNTPVRIGHGLQIMNSSQALKDTFEAFLKDPDSVNLDGVRDQLLESSPLLKRVIEDDIVLEMCPKSNVQTHGIRYHYLHPAVFLSRLGVKVAISTDNETISNTNIVNEFVKLYKHSNMNYADFKRLVLSGYDGIFIMDPEKKEALKAESESHFSEMENDLHQDNKTGRYPMLEGIFKLNHQGQAPNHFQSFLLVTRAQISNIIQIARKMSENLKEWLTLEWQTHKKSTSETKSA